MGVAESVIVHKYAYRFVEDIAYREDVWRIYDEVHRIAGIIQETHLNRILNDSTVSQEDKADFVRNLRRSEYRMVNDLIETILQEGHADLLLAVLEDILLKISNSQNEFDMHVTAFQPLSQNQKDRLVAIVEDRFSLKVRQVIEEIDKEILGGFIVNVNHRVIDTSVRTQLGDIRKKL